MTSLPLPPPPPPPVICFKKYLGPLRVKDIFKLKKSVCLKIMVPHFSLKNSTNQKCGTNAASAYDALCP